MVFRIRKLSVSLASLINFVILFGLLLAPFFASVSGLKSEDFIYPLCLVMTFTVLWMFYSLKYIFDDLFNFYTLFLLAAVLFNGGQVFLEVFRLNKNGILDGEFSPEILVATLYLVILSLASFHAGGFFGFGKLPRTCIATQEHSICQEISARTLRMVGYVLICVSIVPVLKMTFDAIQIVLQTGYLGLFQREVATGMSSGLGGIMDSLADFFMPGVLFVLAGSKGRAPTRNIIWASLLIYCCALLFLGHRSYATMFFIAGLWVRHKVVRPLPWHTIFILGAVLLFIVFPMIKLTRDMAWETRVNPQVIAESFLSLDEHPAIVAIKEMGGSMRTIAHTLNLIPGERPFAMGSTYVYGASVLIPNLFWDVHPSVEHGNLGRWLTIIVDPYIFSLGGGLGYSFIAEAYANFGWWGVPFVMGLIGVMVAKVTRWAAEKDDYGRIAVVAGCIATMLFWPRADITIFVRMVGYYFLLPYAVFLFVRKKLYQQVR